VWNLDSNRQCEAEAFAAMTEFSASPSPSSSPEKNDVALEGSPSEAIDSDSIVQAMDTDSEALNTGANEVAVVTSLREAAQIGEKGMSVDESHHSEAVIPSQIPPSTDFPASKGLNETRTELLQRVQALKKDLENWRGKLDTQVKSYREELGDLRSSLNSEVEQLRVEFQDLRSTLKQQRELTSAKFKKLDEPLETQIDSKTPLPVKTEVTD